MIISDKPPVGVPNLYTRRVKGTDGAARSAETPAVHGEATQDQVDISPAALAMQKAVDTAAGSDDIRQEKVTQLREQIAKGQYKVPVDDLARRFIADA